MVEAKAEMYKNYSIWDSILEVYLSPELAEKVIPTISKGHSGCLQHKWDVGSCEQTKLIQQASGEFDTKNDEYCSILEKLVDS